MAVATIAVKDLLPAKFLSPVLTVFSCTHFFKISIHNIFAMSFTIYPGIELRRLATNGQPTEKILQQGNQPHKAEPKPWPENIRSESLLKKQEKILPRNRFSSFWNQIFINFWERLAPEKSSIYRKWWRVRRLDNTMLSRINEFGFFLCKSAPQYKNYIFFFIWMLL